LAKISGALSFIITMYLIKLENFFVGISTITTTKLKLARMSQETTSVIYSLVLRYP